LVFDDGSEHDRPAVSRTIRVDCQVQHRRFTAALDEFPEEFVLGPVRAHIRNELQGIELPARARVPAPPNAASTSSNASR
jgi:hypothetical protein